jgi:hypothetical protein
MPNHTQDWQKILPGVPLIESPWFDQIMPSLELSPEERRIALDLHRLGYAVFEFPDPQFDAVCENIRQALRDCYDWEGWRERGWQANEGLRVQDAWKFDQNVRGLAANRSVLALLEKLYGRPALPFQTLNFPVGTQQSVHSDSVHFSSIPERFMCGVWVAFEDIHADAGPLIYHPRSNRWPIFVNEHIGVSSPPNNAPYAYHERYQTLWQAEIKASGASSETFCAKKGQALIWAANLLHGGARHRDPDRTRWSQVTHYYFADCAYYTPFLSDPAIGKIHFKDQLVNIASGETIACKYAHAPISHEFMEAAKADRPPGAMPLPFGFDPVLYLAANPDVAAAKMDPLEHYLQFGIHEDRKLRP